MPVADKHLKAKFGGEWMWVEVIRRPSMSEFVGKLDNNPVVFSEVKHGDVVRCVMVKDKDYWWWEYLEKAPAFEVLEGGKCQQQ